MKPQLPFYKLQKRNKHDNNVDRNVNKVRRLANCDNNTDGYNRETIKIIMYKNTYNVNYFLLKWKHMLKIDVLGICCNRNKLIND